MDGRVLNEKDLEGALYDLLWSVVGSLQDEDERPAIEYMFSGNDVASEFDEARIHTFNDASLLTMDKGIVITLKNGAEFQVTIKQSARPKNVTEEEYEDGYDGEYSNETDDDEQDQREEDESTFASGLASALRVQGVD